MPDKDFAQGLSNCHRALLTRVAKSHHSDHHVRLVIVEQLVLHLINGVHQQIAHVWVGFKQSRLRVDMCPKVVDPISEAKVLESGAIQENHCLAMTSKFCKL